MKKIISISTILLIIVTFPSCEENPLKILPPQGQVADEYWSNKEELKATLIGAYQRFAEMDERLFYYGELRADMLEADENLPYDYRNIMEGNIYPGNEINYWGGFYTVINYCNSVLKYAPHVKKDDETFSDFKFNAYKAEAVFLRSLAYFYLVRVFHDVPFVLKPYDSDKQDLFPEKTQGEVVLDSLEAQLNRHLNSIPKEYETLAKTKGRATYGAFNALLADIALWKYEYEDCIDYVNNIQQSDVYNLVRGGEWFTIFSEGNTAEGIFEFQFDSRLDQNNSLYGLMQPQSNNFLASNYAMDLLFPQRSNEIVRGDGTIREEDRLIWKYIGANPDGVTFRSGENIASANWIVYRLAGVLLMKAEALSQTGRYDEALDIVNQIRTRAVVSPITSHQQTPNAFEDLILEERARELAYEGKRWFDLMRMGRRNNYERKAKFIELIIKNVPATQKRALASKLNDPNGWYFPIYSDEIENNLNLEQNPYYQIYE
jgi:hypothetical protein